MLKDIWNWLVQAEKHAVENILADFHSVVGRLHAAADVHYETARDAAIKAANLNSIETAALAEAERAKAVAMSIASLISVR
jgi:hypothetical protein